MNMESLSIARSLSGLLVEGYPVWREVRLVDLRTGQETRDWVLPPGVALPLRPT